MKHHLVPFVVLALAGGCAKTDPAPKGGPAPATAPAGATVAGAGATTKPAEYVEVPLRGRIYVVGSTGAGPKATAGELPETTVTKIGYGPNGETVVFEADNEHIEKALMAEYDRRHPPK
jgi:hypothetical protein